jgi:YidC/Oxa1 family membrane protein insertase
MNPEASTNKHVAMRFFTREIETPARGVQDLPLRVFLGPKDRGLLNNEHYAQVGYRYDETLVSPFGCTWCVFQPVVDVLVWLLTMFEWALKDWGLAIIALVVVVRLLLHPITKRSQRSMMRMAKLGPEMEKLKKKYGDDKEAMAKAMGEFYREHGMAALPLGCLPMLLQTPIWIALYSTLQAELRLRQAPFLYGWTWIDDLAKPDNLIDFGTTINLFFFTIHGINILPLLLALVFWVNMKFQPTPAAMTPEQQTQQTIMKWMMVLMFPIFLYKAPSGLNLYIITSTLIGIWESKRVRDQFKREEEQLAAEQPTLVKDKAPRTARSKKRSTNGQREKPQLTGWRAKWAQVQEQIHQAQEEAARRAADRGKGKR